MWDSTCCVVAVAELDAFPAAVEKTTMIRSELRFVIFFCMTWVLPSCGSAYKVEKFKSYRLFLTGPHQELEPEMRSLIEEFNIQAGQKVLTYARDAEDANSAIVITSGLKTKTDGKVGLGQWLAESKTSDAAFFVDGRESKQKVFYSMRIEFDLEYFTSRIGNDSTKNYEKQKLFFHEVGHGLEMNHNNKNVEDLMYPDISGNKDFNYFFQNVRRYMSDSL